MPIANALRVATAATQLLEQQGIRVFAAMANGRRPVLFVDRLPDGVPHGIKRQHPNGQGGTTVVRACEHYGCQLEHMADVYTSEQAERLLQVGRTPLRGVPHA